MKRHLLPILLIVVVSLPLYANTLNNGFVYDDEYTIENNTLIKGFDNLPLLFNNSAYFGRSGEMSYRPVVTFSYLVDYALYDLKPWGYHLTNLLLHAINGVLLYVFLTLILTPYSLPLMPRSPRLASPALLASIFFVSHPVLTEVVNCISYREDLLVFLFYMITLCLYMVLRQPATGHRPLATAFLYLLSYLSFLLALLSKEMAVTLPLIVLCYEWLYGEEKEGLISRLFSRYIIGYVAITVFYLYLRFYLFYNPEEQTQAWGLIERFLTMPWFVISYLKLSLFPVQLSADYVINPMTSILSPSFIWPFFSLGSLLAVSLFFRERKGVFFGTLFFLIALLPVYNIIPISNPLAERYLYLPMAGFVIISVVAVDAIWRGNKRLLLMTYLLILCIFAFAVVKRNTVWRDNYSLWTDAVSEVSNSSKAHNGLGVAYYELSRIEDAITEYREALRLKPDYPYAHHNLGIAYWHLGRIEDAISEYREALRLKPDYPYAHNNLGNAYNNLGRTMDAVAEYREALRLKPDYPEAHNNLGNAYGYLGLTEDAASEYKEALRLKPDSSEIHHSLGIAYWHLGRIDDAISEYREALRLKPDYPEAHSNLGIVYDNLGRIDDAISEYIEALRLRPDYIEIHFNLGMAYKKKGLKDEARRAFEDALKINPNDTEARQELESL